ncbi:hypothetical protein WG628_07290 [Stenotrophomonas maltophilia]|nr:hypothetical protein [Stenotrophomonas maltophilia]
MKTLASEAGRYARASILAVLAAGMLPAQLLGGLLFALEFRRTPVPALSGGAQMFALAACGALAVLLPMALIQHSRHRLRRTSFVGVGFGVATLAMAFWTWPGADNGPLLQRLRYVDTFDVVGYGLLVLAAGGFGAVAGLAFHTVFGLCIDGCAGPARVPAPGEGA